MRRSWLWFFIPLGVLAVIALVIPIVYNLRLQLTPEQLAAAQQRWRDHGTPDYDLQYTARIGRDPADEYWVKVRGGKVVALACNGQMLRFDDLAGLGLGLTARMLRPEDFSSQTVAGFFRQIEARLQEDARSTGRRNFARADFDVRDGHPTHYVHRVAGTSRRLEWQIKLTRVGPPADRPGPHVASP
jgi:hypothetical protein